MVNYATQPAQFRLPGWAHEFLIEESSARGVTKTQVVVEGLEYLRRSREESALKAGYVDLRDVMLEEAQEWNATLVDGWDDEEW